MKRLLSVLMICMLCLLFVDTSTAEASGIKLNRTKLTMTVGDKYTLRLGTVTHGIKWESIDSDVATVSNKGVIKAKEYGYTIVSATYKSKYIHAKSQ